MNIGPTQLLSPGRSALVSRFKQPATAAKPSQVRKAKLPSITEKYVAEFCANQVLGGDSADDAQLPLVQNGLGRRVEGYIGVVTLFPGPLLAANLRHARRA